MPEGWSHIKDSGDFIKKLKNIDHIPQDAIMVKRVPPVYILVFLMMLV